MQELVPDQLWIQDIPYRMGGFECGARMTVVRMPDGSLWIHSPVRLTDELKERIDAVGPVRHVVSPSRFHYMHLVDFARAYPDARIYVAPNFKKPLEGVRVQGMLRDSPEPEWAEGVDQAVFRGSRLYGEVDFFHRRTRTLILTDLCFNIPPDRGWSTTLVARMLGILGRLSASRSFAVTIRDHKVVRASLERILAWDFDRLILSHGNIVPAGGKAAFRQAFAWFLDRG